MLCCVLITFPHRTAPGKAPRLVYINACTHTHASRGRQSNGSRKWCLRQPSEGQRVTRGELRAVIAAAGRRRDSRGSIVMGASLEGLIRSQFIPTWYHDLFFCSTQLPLCLPCLQLCMNCGDWQSTWMSSNYSCKNIKREHSVWLAEDTLKYIHFWAWKMYLGKKGKASTWLMQ